MNLLERAYSRLDSSMRARILVPTAFLFALTLATMVAAAVHFYGADMERGRQERAELFAGMVASGVSNVMLAGRPREVPVLLDALVQHRSDIVSASLISPSGFVSSSSSPRLLGTVPWRNLERLEETKVVTSPGGNRAEYAVLQPIVNAEACARCHGTASHVNGWLDLRFTREPVIVAQSQLAKTLTLSAAAAFVCLLGILLWLLGRESVTPIRRLVDAMRRAEAGELTVHADEGRPDELGVAARGFDATLAALRRSQAELEAFYRERMVRADRFAAVGEIATGLAHEIKNPLAGLQGSAELLAREAEGPAREYATIIAREARRVDGLVRELLDLARPAALQSRRVNVHDLVGDVLVLARGIPGGDRIAYVERYDPSLPDVHGDDEKLTQVILNLLRNAVDAVAGRPSPQITIETGVASLRLRAASGRSRPLGRISVQDNGPGIPESMLQRLFTPFATSKPHGTGLGLAISRRIVEAHGGRIEVKNRAAGGAEANIYLPLELT
jgi:nitrogen-specific signal transduction histidine kinase